MRLSLLEIRFLFSEASVHLFNANIIKSDFLMRLIESTEMLRNLLFLTYFITRNSAFRILRETTDDKNKPAWEKKFEPD